MNDVAKAPLAVQTPTRVRYVVLAWFCSLSMITYIDRVCITQAQDSIREDLGLSAKQMAYTFSAFALAYAFFEVPSGWLGDILGPRKVLARIVLCWSLFTALTGSAWNYASLLVFRFLFGAGEAGAYPNMARGSRNWFPFEQRGFAQGMVWTFGRWGGAVAPLLTGLLTYAVGWRGAFWALGVVGVVWMLAFSYWFRNTPREHAGVNEAELAYIEGTAKSSSQPPRLSWPAMLSSSTLWCLSIMYFCSNSGWSFFITWVTPYMKNDMKLEGVPLMLASGAPLLFGGIGCALGGVLTDRLVRDWGRRWGRTAQGVVAYFVAGVCFLLALWLTKINVPLALVALCFASLVKDLAMGASWSTTIDIGHRYSGTVAGFMNTIGNLGTVVSPPLVEWLANVSGTDKSHDWSISLYYYATMFFIASGCWFFINPRKVVVYSHDDHARLRAEGMLE